MENAKKKKVILISCIAAVVLIGVIVAIILLTGSKYTDPIEAAIAITYYGDKDELKNAIPEEYMDWYKNEYGEDFEDYLDDWDEDYWIEEYGEDYKVTYEVKEKEDVDKDTLEELADALEEKFDIDASEVKKAKLITVEYFIEGEEGSDSSEWEDLYSVKIRNKWYLVEWEKSESGDNQYITFCYDAW